MKRPLPPCFLFPRWDLLCNPSKWRCLWRWGNSSFFPLWGLVLTPGRPFDCRVLLWFCLKMEDSLLPNIHVGPEKVLFRSWLPCKQCDHVVSMAVPSVIMTPAASSVLSFVMLFCLQLKSSISQKHLTATWDGQARALHNQYPPSCDGAESRGFPGSPEQEETWESSCCGTYLPAPTGNHCPRELQDSRSIVGPLSI